MNEKYHDNIPVNTGVPKVYRAMMANELDRFAFDVSQTATQSLVENLGYTGEELLALPKDARPTRTVERPLPDGRIMEYAFVADYGSRSDAEGEPVVECRYVVTERSDVMFLGEMDCGVRRAIFEAIAREDDEEQFPEDLLEALVSEVVPDGYFDIECRGFLTHDYTCDLASGVFDKNVYGAFVIGHQEVASLHGSEVLDDTEDQIEAYDYYVDQMDSEEEAADIMDWLNDINEITEEDFDRMREVLYWLQLPGGMLVEDVTDDYVDPNN